MIDVDVGCIAERSGGVMKNVFLTQSDGKKKNLLVLLWNAEIFYIVQRCSIYPLEVGISRPVYRLPV